jgi:iron complex outermembrane receptor protein
MRCSMLIRCSASLGVLALATTPAFAQTSSGTDSQAQTGTEQGSTAGGGTPAAPAGDAAADDTIVVTGLRSSLRSAQNFKRNSDQIIDSIVAEDIGKLPDVAVSDTAARIPGIQVVRERGEAGSVLLRGLSRDFYTTTYNGREIFTAETRSVALQDFPAGGISAIDAFKTSTANLVEPGLSGLINVRSRRPFDFTGLEVAGSVWGNYPTQSRDFSPNGQLLLSDRWTTSAGEFGALINFSYTRLHYQDSIRRHGFFIADLAGGRSPDWPEIHYNQADRWRPSVNGALQWRPSPGLEFYVEGLWQGYRENVTDNMWAQPLWNGGSATYSNIVRDGPNIVSGTVTRAANPGETWGFQGATKRDTNTYQFAAGGSYDAGALHVTGDVARTSSSLPPAHRERRLRDQHQQLFGRLVYRPGRQLRPDLHRERARFRKSGQLHLSRLLRGLSDRQGQGLAGAARFRVDARHRGPAQAPMGRPLRRSRRLRRRRLLLEPARPECADQRGAARL